MAQGDFKSRFRQWIERTQQRLIAWSYGRNGADELATIISNLAVLLVVIDLFLRSTVLSAIALVLFAYTWFRIASKNIEARRRENTSALKALGPAAPWLINPFAAGRENKSYKHLSCPSCGQRVRVPRHKGKLRITCPKCKTRFDAKA